MADTVRESQPTQGSNPTGAETDAKRRGGASAGTDTQLHLAAKGGKKDDDHKNNDVNNDEKVIMNNTKDGFLKSTETDE